MKKAFLLALLGTLGRLSAPAQSIKFPGDWKADVGLMVAKPVWAFGTTHSVGFGVDASLTRPLSEVKNLYVGGRVYFAHYMAQKETAFIFATGDPANLIGILGDAHYIYQDKFVFGANLGLGLRFPAYFGTAGLARAGYIGYQLPVNNRMLTLAVCLSRTTLATHVFALRGSISL
ncbi:hypothetical protein [Larkinella rosea]|uniref:Outer membrane protein beta-barrel domain-containing protein n=1 Tax=Larkinella rosea TaxID=2025312 RepID=A0A3P1BNF6_9BACT|nr:hypothetical protein [Larkinella rosea]RRB02599.1 hypothetical protein EHT25_19315 [Larkinella rosea]